MARENTDEIAMLYFAYQDFSQNIDLEMFDITKTQHRILFLASYLNYPSMKKIIKIMRITKQGFNKAYRDLEERDLITSVPSEIDSRSKLLQVTAAGEKIINHLNAEQNDKIKTLLANNNGNWELVLKDMVNHYLQDF